jgi:hypothetical protein
MIDREITAAALRWHTARTKRLAIGAEQRRYQKEQKQRTGFGGASSDIGKHLTSARRLELAAARKLFTLCTKVREIQLQTEEPGEAIDVEARQIGYCGPNP